MAKESWKGALKYVANKFLQMLMWVPDKAATFMQKSHAQMITTKT